MKVLFEDGPLKFVDKQRENHMVHDFQDIGGFLAVTFLLIHFIHPPYWATKKAS